MDVFNHEQLYLLLNKKNPINVLEKMNLRFQVELCSIGICRCLSDFDNDSCNT